MDVKVTMGKLNGKARAVTVTLLAVLLAFSACGGKKDSGKTADVSGAAQTSSSAAAKQADQPPPVVYDPAYFKEFVENGRSFWEDEVTETDIAKAPGYIARGKRNLKITGPVTEAQLQAIGSVMSEGFAQGNHTLLRLDLRETTGLEKISKRISPSIGAIYLPEGLSVLGNEAFRSSWLYDISLPSSLTQIGDRAFNGINLPAFQIPAFITRKTYPYSELFYSFIDYTAVFAEGTETVNVALILNGTYRSKITAVIPASAQTVECVNWSNGRTVDGDMDLETLCFYGETPPAIQGGDSAKFLLGVKTVYAPQQALKAYEDAYFNITAAEFKPIPSYREKIESWMVPADWGALKTAIAAASSPASSGSGGSANAKEFLAAYEKAVVALENAAKSKNNMANILKAATAAAELYEKAGDLTTDPSKWSPADWQKLMDLAQRAAAAASSIQV